MVIAPETGFVLLIDLGIWSLIGLLVLVAIGGRVE